MDAEISGTSDAFQETLELLEWPRLCDHLSTFASTSQGCVHCKNLPLPSDLATSRLRLAETLEMHALDAAHDGGVTFQGIHDLEALLARCVKGGIASGEELLKVAETLAAARRLRRQIDDPEMRPVTTFLLFDLATLPDLEKLLRFGLEEGGRVADRASERLARLRGQCQRLFVERRDLLQELVRRFGSKLQDTVIANRNNRPVLALKAGAVAQLSGIVHDSSASGSTVFFEPQPVIPLGNRIAELQGYILEEEQLLLTLWSQKIGENYDSLQHLGKVMLQLDVALARARYGEWLGGVPCRFDENPNASFTFDELRHPLLVWKERHKHGEIVIPVTLGVPSKVKVVAITGPNTGGKTVTLKSVGLAVLMARAGLLMPCIGTPTLPWCDQVLADIGDEQSLQQSLSTFSGHLIRINRILHAVAATPGTVLVLLDEIGAGTDPLEGTALAIALLKTFADRVRLTIATTHFGELKTLKYSDSRFENASVSFDSETLSPTYSLQWGIPGRSNALAIAGRLGLDSVVLERAQELLRPTGGEDVNNVIAGLENQRIRQQAAAEAAAELLARTEILHEELLMQWQRQSKLSEEAFEGRRRQLEASIHEAQQEVSELIKRLRTQGADGETARRVGQQLRQMEKENSPKLRQRTPDGWSPQVGEQIRLLALGKAGEVLSISEDGLQLTVRCGVFRSTVNLSGVESLDGRKPIPPDPVVKINSRTIFGLGTKIRTEANTVDVRGLRVHEAEVVVEEYLRKVNGPLWIIHGVGTGKLKRGLRQWLESLTYVEKVSDANSKDGGAGCSVVLLR